MFCDRLNYILHVFQHSVSATTVAGCYSTKGLQGGIVKEKDSVPYWQKAIIKCKLGGKHSVNLSKDTLASKSKLCWSQAIQNLKLLKIKLVKCKILLYQSMTMLMKYSDNTK